MQRAGIFKSSVLVDVVNYAGLPSLAIYGFSMFAYPWIVSHGSWLHVQAVWDRWQSLNAGALAFLASLVAFNISRFNENRQREREFVAAKAFLPSTLSSLLDYCSRCAFIYTALWRQGEIRQSFDSPDLPQDYRDIFSNCIRHADPEVGSYLSNILVCLQVQDARLRDALNEGALDKYSLIAYVLRLGELHALLSDLFGFARGEEVFQATCLSWKSLRSAYLGLDLDVDEFFIDETMNLQAFTKRWLERTGKRAAEKTL